MFYYMTQKIFLMFLAKRRRQTLGFPGRSEL